MRDQYFSRCYRGWTLQQTDRGWVIINAPNRDQSGPISPGPYSTYGIAEHVVDRIMDNSYGPKDNPRNYSRKEEDSSIKYEYDIDDETPVYLTFSEWIQFFWIIIRMGLFGYVLYFIYKVFV